MWVQIPHRLQFNVVILLKNLFVVLAPLVFCFGVLLLEILSGRKANNVNFEDGNIVEWAVPLIKVGDISAILISSFMLFPYITNMCLQTNFYMQLKSIILIFNFKILC